MGSRHLQILPLGCNPPHALPGTLAGSGVFGQGEKSVRVASKMRKFTLTGVKKGHFDVTDVKIDSQMLSLKKR